MYFYESVFHRLVKTLCCNFPSFHLMVKTSNMFTKNIPTYYSAYISILMTNALAALHCIGPGLKVSLPSSIKFNGRCGVFFTGWWKIHTLGKIVKNHLLPFLWYNRVGIKLKSLFKEINAGWFILKHVKGHSNFHNNWTIIVLKSHFYAQS